jgi:hypothetical protein
MIKNPIDNLFGIEREEETEVVVEQTPVVLEKVDKEKNQLDEDFEFARTNIIDTINDSKEAIAEMINVAKLSQHPRSYEVLANMMKMQIESNKDLLELRKSKKELSNEDSGGPTTVNNNLIMSTAEVLKLIGQKKE